MTLGEGGPGRFAVLAAWLLVLANGGCECGVDPGDAGLADAGGGDSATSDAAADDDGGGPSGVALPPQVRVSFASPGIAPGDEVSISIEVIGGSEELSDHEILLSAQEPGPSFAVDPAHGELRPGARPSTGPVRWLGADGAWSEAEVVHGPAVSSAPSTVLPSASEGLWRLTAWLRESASGALVAIHSVQLLVAARPAMALSVSRLIANLDDPVRVDLTTAAGGGEEVRVATWLEAPDGRQRSLPDGTSELELVHDGPAQSLRRPLWQGSFGALAGRGTYRVQARMYDRASGDLLATGDAAIVVCDEPSRVSGVVRDESGAPISPLPGDGLVVALEASVDRASSALADIGPDGSFAVELPPGTYSLIASDAGRPVGVASLVIVACGESVVMDLGAEMGIGRGDPVPPSELRVLGGASSLPRPTVSFLRPTAGRVLDDAVLANDLIGTRVARNNPDVVVIQRFAAIEELDGVARRLREGGGELSFPMMETALTADASAVFSVQQIDIAGDAVRIDARYETLNPPNTIWAHGTNLTPPVGREVAAIADALSPRMSRPNDGSLYELIRPYRRLPTRPSVTVAFPEPTVALGSTVTATVRVVEEGTGVAAPPGRPIRVTRVVEGCNIVARPECQVEEALETGDDGSVSIPFEVLGPTRVSAEFERIDGATFQGAGFVTAYVPSGDLEVHPDRAAVRHGQSAGVTVIALRAEGSVAGRDFTLSSTYGALDAAGGTTGGDGTASATFTAGERSGLARIAAGMAATPPPGGGGGETPEAGVAHVVVDGQVDFSMNATPPTVVTGGSGLVSMDVRVGGAAVAALRIDLRSSDGALDAAYVETDSAGHAQVRWTAPTRGSGTASVDATLHVDGRTYPETVSFAFGPACSAPPPARYCRFAVPFPADQGGALTDDSRVFRTGEQDSLAVWAAGALGNIPGPVAGELVTVTAQGVSPTGAVVRVTSRAGGGTPTTHVRRDGVWSALAVPTPPTFRAPPPYDGPPYTGMWRPTSQMLGAVDDLGRHALQVQYAWTGMMPLPPVLAPFMGPVRSFRIDTDGTLPRIGPPPDFVTQQIRVVAWGGLTDGGAIGGTISPVGVASIANAFHWSSGDALSPASICPAPFPDGMMLPSSIPESISPAGHAVLRCQTGGNLHLVLPDRRTITALDPMRCAAATRVSNHGVVVCQGRDPSTGTGSVFVRDPDGTYYDLRDVVVPTAGETGWTRVWAINGNDEILAASNLGLWLLVPSGG